jgi:hypothetical protein
MQGHGDLGKQEISWMVNAEVFKLFFSGYVTVPMPFAPSNPAREIRQRRNDLHLVVRTPRQMENPLKNEYAKLWISPVRKKAGECQNLHESSFATSEILAHKR